MDDSPMRLMETLFYQKIMLYHDLLHCFNAEREALIEIDLDQLWKIAKEKEEVSSKINSIRQEITSTINLETDEKSFDLSRILGLIPRGYRTKFHALYRTLTTLKREAEVLRKENMIFIDDSLQFLDEMISVITGETRAGITYNDKCHLSKSDNNILISREA